MMRKTVAALVIGLLGLAAGVLPAGAIAVERGPDKTPTDVIIPQYGAGGAEAGPNDAHGPACGTADAGTPDGCANHTSPDAALENGFVNPNLNAGANFGAWNSVFQSSENSAICGIWASTDDAEAGFEDLACNYVAP